MSQAKVYDLNKNTVLRICLTCIAILQCRKGSFATIELIVNNTLVFCTFLFISKVNLPNFAICCVNSVLRKFQYFQLLSDFHMNCYKSKLLNTSLKQAKHKIRP